MDVCAIENPVTITNGKENATGFLNTLEHFAIRPATDALRAKQAGPIALIIFDLLPCLLEPVAAEVRLTGNATFKDATKFVHVFVAEFAPHKLVAEKWRIADDDIALRPVTLRVEL